MKSSFFNKFINIIYLIWALLATIATNAQEIRVIDNKGTLESIRNNQVTTAGTAPTTPLEGDIWFDNSDTNNIITKIYDGTVWIEDTDVDNAWRLDGNTGTVETTDFIGSTDAQDVVLKANGAERIRLVQDRTQVLVNNATVFNNHPLVIRASGDDILAFQDATGTPRWHWNFFGGNGLNFVESGVADYRLFLEDGGNVGINTGNPSERLHVAGNMQLDGIFRDSDGDAGVDGYILSSTNIGTDWIDLNSAIVDNKTTNYTLVLGDNGKVITFNSATDVTLTVPSGLPIGFNISIYQTGNGQVTIVGSSTTILNRLSRFKTAGKDAGAGLIATSTNNFHLTGDLKL